MINTTPIEERCCGDSDVPLKINISVESECGKGTGVATWGSIQGDIYNQADLIALLESKGVVSTYGEFELGDPRLIIDWDNDLVPGETITWLEKHGLLKNVLIETETPQPLATVTQEEIDDQGLPDSLLDEIFFLPALNYYKSTNLKWLILDNGGDTMRWLVFSKPGSLEPEPPGENNYVDDYMVDGYVE